MTFWDFCAPFYNFAEAFNGKAYGRMIKTVRRFVPYGANVLDVACGTGNISIGVSDKAWKVTACDISVPMLKAARGAAKRKGARNVMFGKADIYRIEAKDSSYDVVIASMVLHLLEDPKAAAKELMRVAGRRVIIPMPLTKKDDGGSNLSVNIYKLFGFRPKRELDLRALTIF